jgi:hypothetical protein
LTNFLALYRGQTISGAKLVAVSAEPELVADFVGRMLSEEHDKQEPDGVLRDFDRERQGPLQLVRSEARD